MTNQGNRKECAQSAVLTSAGHTAPPLAPAPSRRFRLFHEAAVRGLAIFPIIEVPNSFTFTLKLSGTVVASNAVAALMVPDPPELSAAGRPGGVGDSTCAPRPRLGKDRVELPDSKYQVRPRRSVCARNRNPSIVVT